MPLVRYVRFQFNADGSNRPSKQTIQTSDYAFSELQNEKFTDNIRVTLSNGYFVCGHEKASPGYTLNTNAPGLYFHYVADGKGTYNGLPFEKQDIFVIRPHARKKMIADHDQPWEIFWCVWKGEVAKVMASKLAAYEDNRFYRLDANIQLQGLFRYLIYNNHREKKIEKLVNSFAEMLLADCRLVEREDQGRQSASHAEVIREMQSYIDRHFQTVTVEGVAQMFHYNRRYLSSLFRRQVGSTIQDWIQEAKLRHAEACLLGDRMSMEEVAISSGYSNYSAFIKAFKKKYGMTPSEFVRFYTQI